MKKDLKQVNLIKATSVWFYMQLICNFYKKKKHKLKQNFQFYDDGHNVCELWDIFMTKIDFLFQGTAG